MSLIEPAIEPATRWLPFRRMSAASRVAAAGSFGWSRDAFTAFARLGAEIAEEGKRVLAAAMQIALQSKAQYDRLCDSREVIDEIRRIALATARTSGESRGKIAEARTLIETSRHLTEERTRIMEGLIESVQQSTVGFAAVGASVDEVEGFLALIGELGDQTELLALNAAIEAARAGLKGAGFNVVANEMRLLADKTKAATEQIRHLTGRMRVSTSATSGAIKLALQASERNREYAHRLDDATSECALALDAVSEMAGNVSAAAESQIKAAAALEDRWSSAADSARECTFDADAAAERSQRTISLAERFHTQLAAVATGAGTGRSTQPEWAVPLRALAVEAEACRHAAGTQQMERLRPEIDRALDLLSQECLRGGEPARRACSSETGWELCFGARAVNLSSAEVDTVRSRTGLTATVFVLSESGGHREFLRIATNIKRANGERAIGTRLNPRGSAAPCLLAGERTYGYVYILGVPYLAAYAPIQDKNGATIGAWYVGKPVVSE